MCSCQQSFDLLDILLHSLYWPAGFYDSFEFVVIHGGTSMFASKLATTETGRIKKWRHKTETVKVLSTHIGVQTVKCLVTKQCLMVFGRQTFPVCTGLNVYKIGSRKGTYFFLLIRNNTKTNRVSLAHTFSLRSHQLYVILQGFDRFTELPMFFIMVLGL